MLELFKNWLFGSGKKKGYDAEMMELFGYDTKGVNITTPYSQHNIIYTAIKRIGDVSRQTPMRFVDKNNDWVDDTDIIYNIFDKRRYMVETITSSLQLYGECFLYFPESKSQQLKIRNIPATPIILSAKHMEHKLNENGDITHWIFNKKKHISVDKLVHIKLYNPYSSYRGLSPIQAITLTMETDYSAQKYNEAFFNNGALPESLITIDPGAEINKTVLENLKRQIINKHQGIDKAHLPLVIQGADWKTLNISQREMDYLESRRFSRNDILSVFSVPPFVAGYTDDGGTNRATADVALYIFYINAIIPLLSRIEEEINSFLEGFDLGVKCKFDYTNVAVLQRDYSQKVVDAEILLKSGFSRDEVNKNLDLGFEDVSDVRYLPTTLLPVDQLGKINNNNGNRKSLDINPIPTTNGSGATMEIKRSQDTELYREPTFDEIQENPIYKRNYQILQRRSEKKLKSTLNKYFFAQRKEVLKTIMTSKDDLKTEIGKIKDKQNKRLIKEIKPVYEDVYEKTSNLILTSLNSEDMIELNYDVINSKSNQLIEMNDKIFLDIELVLDGEKEEVADKVRSIYNNLNKLSSFIIKERIVGFINDTILDIKDNINE